MTTYTTVAYCDDDDCCCEHRSGVVLYRGDSIEAAETSKSESPYRGYRVQIETASGGGYRFFPLGDAAVEAAERAWH